MTTVAEFSAHLGLETSEHEFEHGDKLIEGIKHSIEAFIGAEAIHKVREMVESVVEAAVAAKHLGERVGLSTEAVQELGYAASISGASSESMQVSMQHLARSLQELRTKGTGPAADALHALGISASDSEIRHGNLDQVLEIVADRFAKMPDGVKKTSAAMNLFGRSGTTLIPLLNKGSAGIKELREEAERLGVVIGNEGIEKAEEFEKAQKRLGATLTGIKNTAVIAMLPALQEMLEGLQKWISANREAISSTLEEVIHGLAEAFGVVGHVIKTVTEFFQDHEQIATAVLIAVGGVIAAFAAAAVVSWAIAFAPIVAAVAVVAGLILLIENLGDALDALAAPLDIAKDAQRLIELKHQGKSDDEAMAILSSEKEANKSHGARDTINKDLGDEIAKMTGKGAGGQGESKGGTTEQHVTFGPTHVEVHASAGMDEKQLSEKMRNAATAVHKDAVRQAFDALSGGHR